MKSSTLRRANLSKEKIQMLEALAKYRRQTMNTSNAPAKFVPQEKMKERELDILWDNFKQRTKQDKSPTVYLITGFIAGAVVMLIITTLISLSMKTVNESVSDIAVKPVESKIEDTAITFIPADKDIASTSAKTTATASGNQEVYTVQNGDTLESIIIRFYGSYQIEHEKAIKEANHMDNPNALQIGQKLIIPLH